jgi:hypothetical protein
LWAYDCEPNSLKINVGESCEVKQWRIHENIIPKGFTMGRESWVPKNNKKLSSRKTN